MDSAMHVAINGWFWGQSSTGSGQYVHHLVEHLPRAAPGLQLTLVVPLDRSRPSLPHTAAARLCPTACSRSNLGKVWFEQIIFPRVCQQLGADIAHVPYWGSPLRSRAPVVVSVLDLIPLLLPEYRGGPLARLYTSLAAAAARGAAQVITISHASKRDIVKHLGLPGERVHVTHLAADKTFSPQPDPAAAAALRRGHPDLPGKYILYLGGFDVRKNVETLLQVCGWLQNAFGDSFPLVIGGRLPSRHDRFFRDPRLIARALDVENVVRCIGELDEEDKPALYRGALAFLFPSRYEGFGLPVLEALASGLPVVGSNASSIPEIVGEAGMLVEPDDARRMAGALIAVLAESELRQQLSERAVAQAAHFSWEQCARQTVEVYEWVVRSGQRGVDGG